MTPPSSTPHIIHKCNECDKKLSLKHCKIQCEMCLGYFHSKCSLKTRDYQDIFNNNTGWICNYCMTNIFPFNNVETNDESIDVHNANIFDKLPSLNKKLKCNGCNAKIKKNFPALFCKSCNQPFHYKCSENANKLTNPGLWECSQCSIKALPFSSTNQNAFLLTLDGSSEENIESLDKVPSFTLQSLLDDIPGQKFNNTDEFLSDSIKSRYYNPGEFVHHKFPQNKFSLIHLNIASLQKHIDELRSLLAGLKHKFDIICISETRLHDKEPLVNIDINGYRFVHTPTSTLCGGVGMYIDTSLEFDILEDYSTSHSNICETIFVEIKNPSKKNVIIGTI